MVITTHTKRLIVGCVLSDQTEAQITYTVKVRFVPVVFSTLIVQLVLDVGYDWEISWIVGLLTEAPPLTAEFMNIDPVARSHSA